MNEPTGFCDGECPNWVRPKPKGEEDESNVKRCKFISLLI
jgi:hypothetical protein